MAKFEEGDERWIVQDLGDQGTNVNNWHWREYDALEWSREQLGHIFQDQELLDPAKGLSLQVVGVQVEGEAVINNRKNKLIPAYELDLTLKWKGGERGGAGTISYGRVQLPYISDENHDEVPEIKFSAEADDDMAQRLRAAFFDGSKKAVVAKVNEFVAELRSGGPVKPGSKGAAEAEASNGPAGAAAAAAAKAKLSSAKPEDVKPAAAAAAKASSSGKSLSLTEKYYARPSDIFECFVIDAKVRAYTQSNASIEARPGGKFSWFNGSVVGEFVELVPNEKLVMKWRFSTWHDDCFSKVTISLAAPEPGTTVLKLHQTGIPHEDKFGQPVMEQTENGWRSQILTRIRQVFGYGV